MQRNSAQAPRYLRHKLLRAARHANVPAEVKPLRKQPVGVKPPQRQFLGELGHFRRAGFIDLQSHQVGGLGHKVRLGIDELGAPRFLLIVEAKDDQRRRGGSELWRTIWSQLFVRLLP